VIIYSHQSVIDVVNTNGHRNFGTTTIVPAVPLSSRIPHHQRSLSDPDRLHLELGEGVGPFFIGPLSERYGRMPIWHGGNILFILCSVGAALSINISMLVAFRFSTVSPVSRLPWPEYCGCIFRREERGMAMSIALALPLIGPFVAPIVGSYIADYLGGGGRYG